VSIVQYEFKIVPEGARDETDVTRAVYSPTKDEMSGTYKRDR